MKIDEIILSILPLLNNIFTLISVVFLYTLTNYQVETKKLVSKILTGVLIGLVAIILMSNNFKFSEGLVFDSRTILLSISVLYFGSTSTIIGGLIAIGYRVYLGGFGLFVGISTIAMSVIIGILWRYYSSKLKIKNKTYEYLLFGLIVHIFTLLIFLFLPNNIDVLRNLWVIYLIIFPITTMIIGLVMKNQKERIAQINLVKAQKILLQSSIDASTSIEIYVLDEKFNYLTFNAFHQIQIKKLYDIDIQVGDNLIDIIKDKIIGSTIKESINDAFNGNGSLKVVEIEIQGRKILEEHFTPIYKGKDIVGVVVFVKDITEQKKHESEILQLSYYDALTGLLNRRSYHEHLFKFSAPEYSPLSIVTCDINGLKLINDALGHQMGDKIIIEFSNLLSCVSDSNNYLFRIGGDEFVYLLPNTNEYKAEIFVDKLESKIENHTLEGVKISLSYGVATKYEKDSLDEILSISEERMYKHKLFEKHSHRRDFINSILQTLHDKNPNEKLRSDRIIQMSLAIGEKLNMKKSELKLLETVALLHDIGNISVDDEILQKPTDLTISDWEQVKRHCEIGYRIVSSVPDYAEIAQDILSHHEHYDGNGYPRGIAGEDIPLRARIIAIADAYDSMLSDKPYRNIFDKNEAINEIIDKKGTQFDPYLVDLFLEVYNEYLSDYKKTT
ncbi:HD domain-containing phosphohydrolase [Acholeplasma granularum]|uniref:HD domain-containing phosphohydrolase n=1 Tax=Acholeplasma granularum TaxID=264635 RepID=UPI00046FBE90|nr:HD domain-containing phosphohydrolase [Acholeplasma granularum]